MVDVALRATRSRLPQQLRPRSQALSRQAEQRHRCSQTLRYAPPILGGLDCRAGDPAEALLVDVALSVARSRLAEQLHPCSHILSRQAEQRPRCSQTFRYAAGVHENQVPA